MHMLVHNLGNEASWSHHKDSHLGSCGTAPCTVAMGKTRLSFVQQSRRGGMGSWPGEAGSQVHAYVHCCPQY